MLQLGSNSIPPLPDGRRPVATLRRTMDTVTIVAGGRWNT